ncbi:hypothetical protein K4L04_16120 [Phaeobacter inhibens]|uniref:hypothetical protein n=1 Tax=Phaeobacter inhibens TaxID=221822 RepID=UPI0021A80EEF|nr:hypothetical protein [Phaeobacter inhibens]UWR75948.1 hypothetical protein K4L04_16120 [Phaeobacter inhibens]
MFLALFSSVVIAGIVGYLAEKTGFTQNGYLSSIIICVGGAFLFHFAVIMFGIGFRAPGWNAIAASIGALIIVPFHWRR